MSSKAGGEQGGTPHDVLLVRWPWSQYLAEGSMSSGPVCPMWLEKGPYYSVS